MIGHRYHRVRALFIAAVLLSACSNGSSTTGSSALPLTHQTASGLGTQMPDGKHHHRHRLHHRDVGACTFSIAANFNGTTIPAGRTIWFSAVAKAKGLGSSPVTVYVTNATVSFTAGGTPYTVDLPDSAVTFDPNATSATISYDATNGWVESVPSNLGGNTLIDAGQYAVTSALPGGIQQVTLSANLKASSANVTLDWAWSAAVYSQFNADDSQVGVKPVDDNTASQYKNSDHAGTPENEKSYVVGGAMGGGGSNYTGGLSGTQSVPPCLSTLGYVTDSSDAILYAVDLSDGSILKALSFGPNPESPNGLALGNGSIWVSNSQPGGHIFEVNPNSYAITTLPESGGPSTIAFNPNTSTLYSLDYNAQTVTAFSATSPQTPLAVIPNAGVRPANFALDAAHSRLYEQPNDGTLRVIDTSQNAIVATIQLVSGGGGNGVVLSPDGSRAYVAMPFGYGVVVVDTASESVVTTIPSSCFLPDRMAKNSDGTLIYAFCDDGTVDVFNASLQTQTNTVSLDPGHVFGRLATSSDGTKLYVPSNSNKVFVLDADTLDVLQTIDVPNPQAIAVCPGCNT